LLHVKDLRISYTDGGTQTAVVRSIDFQIAPGEVIGVLGESGCGKTTLALSILGLLPATASVKGSIRFRDQNLLALSEKELRCVRGDRISMIFQEPGASLNPVMAVGRQVEEVIRAHRNWSPDRVSEAAQNWLTQVGLHASIAQAYPHQLSGGQLQRVQIAQALSCEPDLIIADEPASGLDPAAQAEILEMIVERTHAALLVITHQPSSLRTLSLSAAMLRGLAGRVIIMYAGQVVETGTLEQLETSALHPYTQALLACSRPCGQPGQRQKLPAIPGFPASFSRLPAGCAFEPRCGRRLPVCGERKPDSLLVGAKQIRCFLYDN
jgi:oligopeptide/dipeptide ABC transporter ATP-binding protein